MPDLGWTSDDTATIVAVIEAVIAGTDADGDVYAGRAPYGASPPFVNVWHLEPEIIAAGLAAETAGMAHQRWQVSPHGRSQMEARNMAERIVQWSWPSGWELVEIGPMVEDTEDEPPTWFVPVTVVFRGA